MRRTGPCELEVFGDLSFDFQHLRAYSLVRMLGLTFSLVLGLDRTMGESRRWSFPAGFVLYFVFKERRWLLSSGSLLDSTRRSILSRMGSRAPDIGDLIRVHSTVRHAVESDDSVYISMAQQPRSGQCFQPAVHFQLS